MDYFCFIQSVVSYIENRLKSDIDYSRLETVTGFSLQHTRDVFRSCTRMPLARYINCRKVSNAAFEIVHTDKSILDIALDYGFESYDTFTRAFRRVTGITPREFRKEGHQVGRTMLTAGIYGPGIIRNEGMSITPQLNVEGIKMEKSIRKFEDSCVLYGVPKVQYCYGECTTFPSSLKACLKYMGQEINYAYLMAASGASFRLRWNTSSWDGGNVGIMCIYENNYEALDRSFKAAGRSYKMLKREDGASKDDFMEFIMREIDEGRPVIAFGIIGPPEACIVTGYRDKGSTLMGWNFFQENPEFARNTEIDESGYFICRDWWENPYTIALMSIGEEKGEVTSVREILQNAINVLSWERVGDYAGGQKAFDAWAKALSDEKEFPDGAVLPLLFERLMCQNDAMTMIGEGRYYAGLFLEWAGNGNQRVKKECFKAAECFKEEHEVARKMGKLMNGWENGEEQARKLGETEVRKGIVKLIMEAKQLDARGLEIIKDIVEKM